MDFRLQVKHGGLVEVCLPGTYEDSWLVVESDVGPVQAEVNWYTWLQVGAELILEQQTGEERILSSSYGFVGGWLGLQVGVAWWADHWRAWSPQMAGTGFRVVALRNNSGAAVFVDGEALAAIDTSCRLGDCGSLGINNAQRSEARGHCAVLEVIIFQAHLGDAEVADISGQMAQRASLRDCQRFETSERHASSVASFIDELARPDPISATQSAYDDDWSTWRTSDGLWEKKGWNWAIPVDEVDLPFWPSGSPELQATEAVVSPSEVARSAGVSVDRMRAIVERTLGSRISTKAPLAGLDSLRLMALAEAFRRELGAPVGVATLTKAHRDGLDLTALGLLADTAATVDKQERLSTPLKEDKATEYAVWNAEGMYEVPMYWVLEAPPVDASALQRALQRLCARHSPLRATREAPEHLAVELDKWVTGAAMVHSLFSSKNGFFSRLLLSFSSWAIQGAWPRYRVCAASEVGLPWLTEYNAADEGEVLEIMGCLYRSFCPPASFALVRCASPRVDFIHIAASHALCDASAFLPLRSDLISFYQEETGGPAAVLPPIPDALALLASRLQAAFLQRQLTPEYAPYLGGWEPTAPSTWGYRRLLHVRRGAGARLRRACEMLHLPLDIALVSALACSLARCDGSAVVRLTLTAPMRDGPGEEAVLGLFTDWRDLDLHVPSSQTLLAVAEEVADIVRGRRWQRSRVAQTSQRVLVNIVGADYAMDRGFSHRTDLGCTQRPKPTAQVHCRTERSVEFQGWQIGTAEWMFVLRLSRVRCPPSWAVCFSETLTQVIDQFASEPLTPVHRFGERPPTSCDRAG